MKKSHCFYSCQTYLRCVLFEDKAFISEGFFLNLFRSLDLIIDINNTVVGNIEVHYVPHFLLSCWKYMTHPQRFFWQITYSSIMFRYLIICIRWCLSLRSIIEDIIHRYSRRPIVNPLDWSVKFAVWRVLYAKKYEESKNPCCHFWKWGYHALFGPGGRSGGQIGVKITNSLRIELSKLRICTDTFCDMSKMMAMLCFTRLENFTLFWPP